MNTLDRPYTWDLEVQGPRGRHWVPQSKPGTSIMQRWRESLWISSAPVSPDYRWRVVVEASLLPVVEKMTRCTILRLTLLTLLLVVTVALCHFFSRGFELTIRKLQDAIASFRQRFDNADRIVWPASSIKELATLSDGFRDMAHALSGSLLELRALNETLEERVRQRTNELSQTNERLSIAQQMARLGSWDQYLVSDHK
jgi:nitrate/nitrite-specific signal transduction histidine kinase